MKNKWMAIGATYRIGEVTTQVDKLPVGIYKTEVHPITEEVYLTLISDKFELPEKLYGKEVNFADRIIKTWESNETGNLGVLLNGLKGTGKTITAKVLANNIDLPVVVVTHKIPTLPQFINEIQQDVVLFFDEYEKMYNSYDEDDHHDGSLLSIMDGALNTAHRRLFVLTTNKTYINENMLQRPSRIRYHRTFGDLSKDEIIAIIDDLLVHKEHKDALVEFITQLEIITVDIVKCLVNEVNIHNESPLSFAEFFNVKRIDNVYNVSRLEKGKEILEFSKAKIQPRKITKEIRPKQVAFTVDGQHFGYITKVIDLNTIEIIDNEGKLVTYRLEKTYSIHSSFLF
jgi:ATPase family associated with various cellular activities (AAA)